MRRWCLCFMRAHRCAFRRSSSSLDTVPGTLQKVTALITRPRADGGHDLLVMQHPTAGVQVPAGTVEENESLIDAAFREVAEETGLRELRLVRRLGTETLTAKDGAYAMLRATPLRKGPSLDAAVLEASFPRAYWCRAIGQAGAFSEIVYEEHDFNVQPKRVLVRYSGWVESDAIADAVERHFFHFEVGVPTQERWVQQAEQSFECYFTPLVPKPKLMHLQQAWLDGVYERLTARR